MTDRTLMPLFESSARVTPTAGTNASTPPTSDPHIGMPSMMIATTSTESAATVAKRHPAEPLQDEPEDQEGGAGEHAVGEVAHPGEAPADRR